MRRTGRPALTSPGRALGEWDELTGRQVGTPAVTPATSTLRVQVVLVSVRPDHPAEVAPVDHDPDLVVLNAAIPLLESAKLTGTGEIHGIPCTARAPCRSDRRRARAW